MKQESIETAERRLEQAEAKLRQASRIYGREANEHPSSVLTNSQRCIEHCAKAIFILMDVNEPSEHTIPVESNSGKQLLNAVYAKLSEEYAQKTARVLFLTELYGSTYPVSEYGIKINQARIEANDFLDPMESDQAYNHAVEVVKLAREIIDTARTRSGMPSKSRDSIINSAFGDN